MEQSPGVQAEELWREAGGKPPVPVAVIENTIARLGRKYRPDTHYFSYYLAQEMRRLAGLQ
jgi:hypothetical protein